MTAPDGRNKHVDSCVYIWDYHLQASVYLAGKYHFLTLKPSDPICSTAKQIVDMLIEPVGAP